MSEMTTWIVRRFEAEQLVGVESFPTHEAAADFRDLWEASHSLRRGELQEVRQARHLRSQRSQR